MRIVTTPQIPATHLSWHSRAGDLTYTVICKASYSLVPGDAILVQNHEPLTEGDRHFDDDEQKSLSAASDLVPLKRRADVIVVGSVFAPPGTTSRRVIARIAVGGVDKSLVAHCDRSVNRDGDLLEGRPFSRMPLTYERARGGPETDNPVGTTSARDNVGKLQLPNFQPVAFEPEAPDYYVPTIGFGPIAAIWPSRARRLGGHAALPPEALLERPEDIDPSYFNAAPLDQQLDELPSNAHLVLEALHPDHPRLVTRLPGHRARALVDMAGLDLTLVCDTLVIDTDKSIATLTWRGSFRGDNLAPEERVIVALEGADMHRSPDMLRKAVPSGDETVTLKRRTIALPERPPLPFGGGGGSGSSPSLAGTPFQAPQGNGRTSSSTTTQASRPSPPPPRPLPVPPPPPSHPGIESPPRPPQAPPPMQPVMAPAIQPPPLAAAPPVMSQPLPQAPPMPPVMAPPQAGPGLGMSLAAAPLSAVPLSSIPQPPLSQSIGSQATPPALVGVPPQSRQSHSDLGTFSPSGALAPAYLSSPRAPAAPAGPVAHDANAASRGVASASDAAARTDGTKAPKARTLENAPAASPKRPRAFVDLLWFDASAVERIRSQPQWVEKLRGTGKASPWLTEAASGEATKREIEPQRYVARAMTRITPVDSQGIQQAVIDAIDDDGYLVRPLVVCEGDLALVYSPFEALRTSIALAEPLGATDKRLKEQLDAAADVAKPERKSTLPMVEAALGRLRTAFQAANKVYAQNYLETAAERVLVDDRSYLRRMVLGGPKLVGTLAPSSGAPITVYLPDELSDRLPLLPRFRARIIAEPHAKQESSEGEGTVLVALALGRAIPPP